MATYIFAVNTNESHLLVTTPSHRYAIPYLGLVASAPQMPTGKEQVVISVAGRPIVAVPFFKSNLVGVTWQDRMDDLRNNYLFMSVGTTVTVAGGSGIDVSGGPAYTISNTAQALYMDGNSYLVSATHPNIGNGRVFANIQDAFTALSGLAPTEQFTIIVSPGTYTESPSISSVEAQLELHMTGPVLILGTLTVDTQNSGTFAINAASFCFISDFSMTGSTSNTPECRLTNVNVDGTLDTSGCEALVHLRNCAVGTLNTRWLMEATNTLFFIQFTTKFADRLDNCSFDAMPIQIDAWHQDRSGFRNCNVTQPGGSVNGDRFRRCTNTWYSFNQQAWTINTPHIQIDLLEDSGVVTGSYTNADITVNAQGIITSASNGTTGVTSVGAFSNTGTANGASIAGSVITMRAGSSTTPGMGHVQTYSGSKCAVGSGTFPQYGGAAVGANLTAMGQGGYGAAGAVTNSANNNTSIGANNMSQVTTANETTAVGYFAANALTTGGFGTYIGSQSGRQNTTGSANTATGYQTLWTGSSSNNTCTGAFSGNVTTGTNNSFHGHRAGLANTSGQNNCAFGQNAMNNGTTGQNNICIGAGAVLAAAADSNELVIGAATTGNGSSSMTISPSYVSAGAGTSTLTYNSGTGRVTFLVSSLRYKNLLPGTPPIGQFTRRLFDLEAKSFTLKNDPTNTVRIGYIAEEVEAIKGPLGNPVFKSLLVYADHDDPNLPPITKTEEYREYSEETQQIETYTREVQVPAKSSVVDGINYYGFVVPLIELCKQQQAQIDALEARLNAAGIP